jgi:flagellar basal body rod protein FlgC
MTATLDTALAGLRHADLRVAVSAQNRANALTKGYVPREVVSTAGPNGGVSSAVAPLSNPTFEAKADATTLALSGTNFVDETVGSMMAVASFKANLAIIQTAADLDKTLVNIKA